MSDIRFNPNIDEELRQQKPPSGWGKIFAWIFFFACLLGLIGTLINPINNETYRALTHITSFAFIVSSVLVMREMAGKAVVIVLWIGLIFFINSQEFRAPDPNEFTKTFVDQVTSYDGVHYRFGGESFLGMDSSGLVRRSLIITYVKLAIFEGKWALLKRAYAVWNSKVALSILTLYENPYTKVIGTFQNINLIVKTRLKAGDLAIGPTGSQVAVYIGGNNWVTSDSSVAKVVIERAPSDRLSVFREEIKLVRFKDSIVVPKSESDSKKNKK